MTTSRRFLLAPSLARLIQKERGGSRVVEGYFPEREGRVSFVHVEENTSSLVLVSPGPAGPMTERVEVPQAHAEALLDVVAGEVDYVRSTLALDSHKIQIQQFIRPGWLELITVEFERDDEARDFYPLPWFGPEVTTHPSYQNQAFALEGLPEPLEVPVTDKVLHSLLDVLENPAAVTEPRSRSAKRKASPSQQPELAAKAEEPSSEEALIRELARTLRPQRR